MTEGDTDADLRAMLAHNGLELVELEYHRGFAQAGEPGALGISAEPPFYDLADALGGRHLLTISDIDGSLDDAARRLADTHRAAAHGLTGR